MSVATVTLKRRLLSRNECRRIIAVTLTGTCGNPDLIDLSKLANPSKAAKAQLWGGPLGSTKALPATDDILTVGIPGGYDAQIVQNPTNPTLKNYQLYLFSSGGTALSSTVPAGLLGVDLLFEIITSQKYE